MSDLIHNASISQSLTFLINSRFSRFYATDLRSVLLLPKLHRQFAEFLKYCSPIAVASSADVLESDLVRLFLFRIKVHSFITKINLITKFVLQTLSSMFPFGRHFRNRFYQRDFIIRWKPNIRGEHYSFPRAYV